MKTGKLAFFLAMAPLALLLPSCGKDGASGPAGPSVTLQSTPTPSIPAHTYMGAWSGSGTAPGQFNDPKGLWVDGLGDIFVADSYNNRIQEIPAAGNADVTWGGPVSGTAPGQFSRPIGVALDPSGNLWTADLLNSRLQELPAGSSTWITIGTSGAGPGQFLNPSYLSFDKAGDLYVADTGHSRIEELPAGLAATVASNWATFGSGLFTYPHGIALDPSGDLFVADQNTNRITELPAGKDPTVGSNWLSLGSAGSGPGQFSLPIGIGFDPSGDLYVADLGNNRLQELPAGKDGTVSANWVTFGSAGSAPGQLDGPNDVKTDSQGNVYVADSLNNRIEKFSP